MKKLFMTIILGLISSAALATNEMDSNTKRADIVYVQKMLGFSFSSSQLGGATIKRIEQNSPAEKSGLELGDTIIEIDGALVSSAADAYALLSEKTKETEIRVKDVNENEFYTYLEIPSKKPTDPSKPHLGSLRKYWSSSYGSKLKLNLINGECKTTQFELYNYRLTFASGIRVEGLFRLDCKKMKLNAKSQWTRNFSGAISKDKKTMIWYGVDLGGLGVREIIWR